MFINKAHNVTSFAKIHLIASGLKLICHVILIWRVIAKDSGELSKEQEQPPLLLPTCLKQTAMTQSFAVQMFGHSLSAGSMKCHVQLAAFFFSDD